MCFAGLEMSWFSQRILHDRLDAAVFSDGLLSVALYTLEWHRLSIVCCTTGFAPTGTYFTHTQNTQHIIS